MFYNDSTPPTVAKSALVEWRGRITLSQKEQLAHLEGTLNIPQAALVRMALSTFLPKLANNGYTENGIKNGYLQADKNVC